MISELKSLMGLSVLYINAWFTAQALDSTNSGFHPVLSFIILGVEGSH